MSTSGAAVDPLAVRVGFADPHRGVEPMRFDAVRDGVIWTAGPVELPYDGDWTVRLDVVVDDFAQATLEATLTLGAP